MTGKDEEADLARGPDVAERVRRFLNRQQRPALCRLRVQADEGLLTLAGEVSSYYERQVAVECTRHVVGVVKIVDQIVVRQPSRPAALTERTIPVGGGARVHDIQEQRDLFS